MKIYISADFEGLPGVVRWPEANIETPHYQYFADVMTQHVRAACLGALKAGATDLLVRDGHHTARNIYFQQLPEEARLVRGWTGEPNAMMAMLDSSFDAAMLVGYHSAAGWAGNPMSHTMNDSCVHVKINGEEVSECVIAAYTASYYSVPLVFVSGDHQLCESAKRLNANIHTVALKHGLGGATVSSSPAGLLQQVELAAYVALQGDLSACMVDLPSQFDVEIMFKVHHVAYRRSFYPGASLDGSRTVRFCTSDMGELLRFFSFVLYPELESC